MNNNMLGHKKLDCSTCYTQPVTWGAHRTLGNGQPPKWRIENTPAAWGSQNPEILVLGFSRGQNQSHDRQPFDQVAFNGMRLALTKILRRLNLLGAGESVESKIRATEQSFAFGSLIRCSIAQWDNRKERYAKSGGGILTACMGDPAAREVAQNCVQQVFSTLPDRLKVVVLMGNQKKYIDDCRSLISSVVSGVKPVNEVAYGNGRVLFVHTVHAKAQGAYIPDWLQGDPAAGKQAAKRELAMQALTQHGIA